MGSELSATDSIGKLESTERHIFPFCLFMGFFFTITKIQNILHPYDLNTKYCTLPCGIKQWNSSQRISNKITELVQTYDLFLTP